MTLKLKSSSSSPVAFSWDTLLPSPSPTPDPASLPSPPTSWLSARDMKLFGAQPLTSTSDIGVVKCKECEKPVLRSFMLEHAGGLFPPEKFDLIYSNLRFLSRQLSNHPLWWQEGRQRKRRCRNRRYQLPFSRSS